MANVLVVGFDPGPAGERAIDFAVNLAKMSGSSLMIVHVLEWSPYSFLTPEEIEERHARRKEELSRAKDSITDPLVQKLSSSGVSVDATIRYGHVAETLAAVAEEAGASQVIVGRSDRRPGACVPVVRFRRRGVGASLPRTVHYRALMGD